MAKTLKREQTGNRQINKLQRHIAGATEVLRSGPFGDGVSIPISITSGSVSYVNHGLNRSYQGFFLHSLLSPSWEQTGKVWIAVDYPTDTTKIIALSASSNVTGSVWVF